MHSDNNFLFFSQRHFCLFCYIRIGRFLQYAQKAKNPPFWHRFFWSGSSPPRKDFSSAAQRFFLCHARFSLCRARFFLPRKDFFLPRKAFPPMQGFPLPRSSFPFLFSISNFSVIADSFQNADFRTADFFSQVTEPFSSVFQARIPEALSRLQILAPPMRRKFFFLSNLRPPLRPFSKLASADSRKASIAELQRRSCFEKKKRTSEAFQRCALL